MFERFTNKARHVVVLAQEEARSLHHNYIGTEHLLLGLFGEPASAAGRVLDRLGMTHDGVRMEVTDKVGIGKKPQVSGHIPFTPRAKKVLELGLRESAALHHGYIGTEHLLLGMVREGNGAAAEILLEHGGDMATVRAAVLDLVPPGAPSRRWLRRRTAATADDPDEGEASFEDDLRTTPAAGVSLDEAARLAGAQPVGSHHLLLATLADPSTAAARALASLGVDLDQARAALRTAEVTGTSDELPEESGRRQMRIHVTEQGLSIEATDPVLVNLGRAALTALGDLAERPEGAGDGGGDKAGQDDAASPRGVIRGDLPVSVSLSGVWEALRDSLEDIRRRAMAPGAHADPADSGDAA
jgi:ATP-dependent Clp protease ATP-binding subunit ClpA